MKTTGNTILVTGGGSGIGLALAQRWHDAGNSVIVTGRNAAKLDAAIAGRPNMSAMSLDVDRCQRDRCFCQGHRREVPAPQCAGQQCRHHERRRCAREARPDAGRGDGRNQYPRPDPADQRAGRPSGSAGRTARSSTSTLGPGVRALPQGADLFGDEGGDAQLFGCPADPAGRQGRGDRTGAARSAHRPDTRPVDARGLYAARRLSPTRSWRCSPWNRRRRRSWCRMSCRCALPEASGTVPQVLERLKAL